MVSERLHHSSHRNSNSKNIELHQHTPQQNHNTSYHSSGGGNKNKGNFFKKRRQTSSKSNETNSESEVDGNQVIISPVAYRHLTNYHDNDVNNHDNDNDTDNDDVFFIENGHFINEPVSNIYVQSTSSEKDLRQKYYHQKYPKQHAIPQNFDENSSYEDDYFYSNSEDEKSICSYTSDRKLRNPNKHTHEFVGRSKEKPNLDILLLNSKDFYDSAETVC